MNKPINNELMQAVFQVDGYVGSGRVSDLKKEFADAHDTLLQHLESHIDLVRSLTYEQWLESSERYVARQERLRLKLEKENGQAKDAEGSGGTNQG